MGFFRPLSRDVIITNVPRHNNPVKKYLIRKITNPKPLLPFMHRIFKAESFKTVAGAFFAQRNLAGSADAQETEFQVYLELNSCFIQIFIILKMEILKKSRS
jgi:hypothetical protein